MDEPLLQWLRLRESADARARADALTRRIIRVLAARRPVHILDLATGAGSNVRYLALRLPRPQRWLVVDRSGVLLADLRARTANLDIDIEVRKMDLGSLDGSLFEGRHLVTASALLDLVSEAWLRSLARHSRAAGAAVLFTITYNGRSSCDPAEPEDDWIRELLNRHQKRDKGLGGPAEGPDAPATSARCFADEGYLVERAPSNWQLGPDDSAIQRTLIDGWAEAAREVEPEHASAIQDWRERRIAHINERRSHIIVGHDDLAAWLP
ncbi:MAG: class I SAM-dependent methyltransferase [Acidobacteria bacterium]|nr:class I SAM-dependent methyltransferase [Acidobacteriota bacterium]